jgi:hypothetical protein
VPSIGSGGDMLELRPVRHSSDAGVICPVAHADVHCAIITDDFHLRTRWLLQFKFRLRLRLLPDIIVSYGGHQRGMGLIAILAVLLQSDLLLESPPHCMSCLFF